MATTKQLKRTLTQSLMFGIIGGPIAWGLFYFQSDHPPLWWCCIAMAIAPPIVDGLKYLRDG